MPLESARASRAQLDQDILLTLADVQAEWARMTPWVEGSWNAVGPRVFRAVSAGQRRAARRAPAYVAAALLEQGIDPTSELGDFQADTLAGIASDGRPLESLIYQAPVQAGMLLNSGEPWTVAHNKGMDLLERIVATQVADSLRVAVGAQTVVTPKATLMVRQVNPGACARCIQLAGRTTGAATAFLRHPKCRCVNVPSNSEKARSAGTDPREYFEQMSAEEQDRTFTRAGAQAIRDGAALNQVVNARRGMSHAASGRLVRGPHGLYTTTEGTSRRGWAYHQMARNPKWTRPGGRGVELTQARLMPESIYEIAKDRDDAIRLLKAYGYF